MHYIVTFHKPTSPDKPLTERLPRLITARRWALLVEINGYVVDNIEKKTRWGTR